MQHPVRKISHNPNNAKFLNQPRIKPIPSCSFAHFRYPALSILSIRCPNFRCEACKYSHSLFCPPIFQSTDPKFYTRSSLRLLTGANKFQFGNSNFKSTQFTSNQSLTNPNRLIIRGYQEKSRAIKSSTFLGALCEKYKP